MTHSFTPEAPERLDVFLARHLPAFSRSKLQRLIEAGHAHVHGKPTLEPKYQVQPGVVVSFTEPEPDPTFPPAENVALTVIFEDDSMVVIDKPVGMVTHPTSFQDTGTLVQAVLARWPEVTKALYDAASSVSRMRPGIVHRLDKDTSGLIVIAKNRKVMLNLIEQFHKRTVHKTYETFLYGTLPEARTVQAPIHRKSGASGLMVASHDPGQGRAAVTTFTPIETVAPYAKWPQELATRARVTIETGRTHQIRVHAKFIGHPVLGDQLYGNKPSVKLSEKLGFTCQQLRAVELTLAHPVTGKQLTFTASSL